MIHETKIGKFEGLYENGLYLFKGITYAKFNRFEEAQDVVYEGIVDCTRFKDSCYQVGDEECGDDSLNLNIYTPNLNSKLPVLVEIHGGAFQTGSNKKNDPYYVIKDKKFIYVTINYRLGIFGYLYTGGITGNLGTSDALKALKWIHNNIEYFGGDASKITVMGSSAGAKLLATLMNIDEANQYFNQAILISGAYQAVRDIHTASIITKKYFDILGVNSFDEMKDLDVSKLLEAQKKLCSSFGSTCMFGPVMDDIIVSKDYYQNLNKKHFTGNILITSSLYEMAFFEMFDPHFKDHAAMITKELLGNNSTIAFQDVQELSNTIGIDKAYTVTLSDYMYRTYAYRYANILSKQGNKVYLGNCTLLPALHTFDHILAFAREDKLYEMIKNPTDKTLKLREYIWDNYTHFVIHGCMKDTNWLDYSSNKQMILDEVCCMKDVEGSYLDHIGEQVFKL